MEIQLKQQHIEAALRDFIAKAGITFDVDEINFTAGRGKDGLTASVALEDPFTAMLDKVSETPAAKAPRAQSQVEAQQVDTVPEPEPDVQEAKPDTDEAPPFSVEEEQAAEAPKKKVKDSLFG